MNISIGSIAIGHDQPVVIIPEGCDNHQGSLTKAKEMAHAAKEAGARIIKFQLHLPDEEMDRAGMAETSSGMFAQWGDLYGFIKKNQLSIDDHAALIDYCNTIGIQYFCTPFSVKAAHILRQIGGDAAYKIGSGETEDLPLIDEVARLGRPMIVATGMSTVEEIDKSVAIMCEHDTPFALMHCISSYPPANEDELHLGVITALQQRYKALVGFSDHTSPDGVTTTLGEHIPESAVIWTAIALGARFIEKHFTIDRSADDADSRFSHDPQTLRRLIATAAAADTALDSRREVYDHERPVWIWAKRSLYAACDIAAGAAIERSMLTSKRPGTGIRSKEYRAVIGKTARVHIPAGSQIQWDALN